jgi:hypothetical protein
MPSKTPAQAKLMRIAAHTKGGYDGVPQKVGADFESADDAKAGKKKTQIEKRYGKNKKA